MSRVIFIDRYILELVMNVGLIWRDIEGHLYTTVFYLLPFYVCHPLTTPNLLEGGYSHLYRIFD